MFNEFLGYIFFAFLLSAPAFAFILPVLLRAWERLKALERPFHYSIAELWVFLAVLSAPLLYTAVHLLDYFDRQQRDLPVQRDDYTLQAALALALICVEALAMITAKTLDLTRGAEARSRPVYIFLSAVGVLALWLSSIALFGLLIKL
jgi:hypothetical protein